MTTNQPNFDEILHLLETTAELSIEHDNALRRIESSIESLLNITATQNQRIEENRVRIERIIEYLFNQHPNGTD